MSGADTSDMSLQEKAFGPKGEPGQLLKTYADQLAEVFIDMFNL